MHIAYFAGGRLAVHYFNVYGPADGTAAAKAQFLEISTGRWLPLRRWGPSRW